MAQSRTRRAPHVALAAVSFAICLLMLPAAATAQSCSFDGTLDMDPEELAASEPVRGNPDASLLVTEFFDPNCPHCQAFHPVMQKVMEAHGNDIRFYMHPVPLWQYSSDQMRAMFIAKQKGKYYEMIDAQLESPHAGKGGMTTDQILAVADQIGLDAEWFQEQMEDPSVARTEVRRLQYEARKAGVESTPTVAIGRKVVARRSADCIGQLIQRKLQETEAATSPER